MLCELYLIVLANVRYFDSSNAPIRNYRGYPARASVACGGRLSRLDPGGLAGNSTLSLGVFSLAAVLPCSVLVKIL